MHSHITCFTFLAVLQGGSRGSGPFFSQAAPRQQRQLRGGACSCVFAHRLRIRPVAYSPTSVALTSNVFHCLLHAGSYLVEHVFTVAGPPLCPILYKAAQQQQQQQRLDPWFPSPFSSSPCLFFPIPPVPFCDHHGITVLLLL